MRNGRASSHHPNAIIALCGMTLLLALTTATAALPEQVDSFVQAKMAERDIPGVGIAVIKGGEIDLVRVYGKASLEFDLPVRPGTPFSVASITKSFTAVAVMMLAEKQLVKLEDRIGAHLPAMPAAWKDVSVRQLLNHTSGLPDVSADDYTTATIAQTHDEAFAVLSARPVDFAPGSAYRYNQTNYMLLGILIASKFGKPFEQAVVEQLFAPLKLREPVFGDARTIVKGRATTYTPYRFGKGRPTQLKHLEILHAEMPAIVYPGGGLNISISDFATWLRALLDERLITQAGLTTLWTTAKLNDGSEYRRPPSPSLWDRYALGWIVGEHDGHRFVGGTGGIRSAFFVYPNDDLAVVVLTNSQSARPESLVQGIANLYFAHPH